MLFRFITFSLLLIFSGLTNLSILISSAHGQILVPGIHGTILIKDVKFTWVIISSDTEISINLRYLGNGSSPPVLVTATALLNESSMKTLAGSKIINGGWTSPFSTTITVNDHVSLYNAFLVSVTASLYTGCNPSPSYPDFCIPAPPPLLNCNQIAQRNFTVLPPDPHGFDSDHDGRGCEFD